MEVPAGLPISSEEWAQTPLTVKAVVIALLGDNRELQRQILEMEGRLKHVRAEVEKLKEQSNKTSRNSSKPPSSDPPGMGTTPKREQGTRPQGGQKGHKGRGRKLKPSASVDRVVISKPVMCQACGGLLLGEDPHPHRHQVTELPTLQPEVTEYQQHTLTCLACGTENQADWPPEMPLGGFGERIQALTGYLSGRFGMSKRDIQELLEDVCRVEMGLGSVPAQEARVSLALQAPVEEAHAYVQAQPVTNVDETGWQEITQQGWLWVCVTASVTVFKLFRTRGAGGVDALLGADYNGIIGSDRYSAYNHLEAGQRQVCWAHLLRDFQALVDRGGHSQIVGRMLLAQAGRMFSLWDRVRDGTLSRTDFQVAMQPIRHEAHCLLHIGTHLKAQATRKTCLNLLKIEPALWTFVEVAGIEPTNNVAERALRRGVLWRRRSFGTQSERGSRFVERILTVVMTLRQQKRNVLEYLTAACQACTRSLPAPSLLPVAAVSTFHLCDTD